MCELEQHVMMLRESGGPLSPGRILSHMRSISCQIGDGSQEDAHEFLRSLRIDKLIFFFPLEILFSFFTSPFMYLIVSELLINLRSEVRTSVVLL